MSDTNVQVKVSVQDDASAELKKISNAFKDANGSWSAAVDGSKKLAIGIAAAGAGMLAFGTLAVKAAMDAEVQIASMDATLNTLKDSTITVSQGFKTVKEQVDGSADAMAGAKDRANAAQIALQGTTLAMSKLKTQYQQGKVESQDYTQKMNELTFKSEQLNKVIKEGASATLEYKDKQVEVTKAIKITASQVVDARAKILAASQAFVKLGFDDEEAAKGMAQLYQRTGDVSKSIELMGLAADLARSKQIDLDSATRAVSLALSGQGRALMQYGIDIKDSATPLEALAILQEKVGGQAKAFGSTTAGQIEILKKSWENLLEVLGEQFLPMVNKLIAAITPFITDTLPKWIDQTKQIIGWLKQHSEVTIILAGAIIGALIPAMVSWATTILTVTIPAIYAMTVALAPYILGGAAIAGMVAGVVWLYKNTDVAIKFLKDSWQSLSDFIGAIWDGIKKRGEEFMTWLRGIVDSIVSAIGTALSAMAKLSPTNLGVSAAKSVISKFASGGTVSGPVGAAQLALVHGGEKIIPAGGLRSGSPTGGGVTVNINGAVVRSDNDITDLADAVGRELMRALRMAQPI